MLIDLTGSRCPHRRPRCSRTSPSPLVSWPAVLVGRRKEARGPGRHCRRPASTATAVWALEDPPLRALPGRHQHHLQERRLAERRPASCWCGNFHDLQLLDTRTRKTKSLLSIGGYMIGKSIGISRDFRFLHHLHGDRRRRRRLARDVRVDADTVSRVTVARLETGSAQDIRVGTLSRASCAVRRERVGGGPLDASSSPPMSRRGSWNPTTRRYRSTRAWSRATASGSAPVSERAYSGCRSLRRASRRPSSSTRARPHVRARRSSRIVAGSSEAETAAFIGAAAGAVAAAVSCGSRVHQT